MEMGLSGTLKLGCHGLWMLFPGPRCATNVLWKPALWAALSFELHKFRTTYTHTYTHTQGLGFRV